MDSSDDYDFTPSANSSLSSLFQSDALGIAEEGSLTYTAPKQPKTKPLYSEVKNEPSENKSSVICARIINIWKLLNNKYVPIGKHGLAIIGSAQHSYELIAYKEKNNVILRVKLSENLELTSKKDGFISFYDSTKQNWLIKFNNETDKQHVLKETEKNGVKILSLTPETTEEKSEPKEAKEENKAKADILSRIAKMGQSILLPSTETVEPAAENNYVDETTALSTSNVITTPVTQFPVITTPSLVNFDPYSLVLAENRSQNAEVRMNLMQISEKLNQVLRAVDVKTDSSSASENVHKSKIKGLELRVENLSKELAYYQEKYMEMQDQVNKQTEMANAAEIEAVKAEGMIRVFELEEEIEKGRRTTESLSEIVNKQKVELEQLQNVNKSSQEEIEKYKSQISEGKSQDNINKGEVFKGMLKQSMNDMFSDILSNFEPNQEYQFPQIQGVVAKNIKSSTLKIIDKFQEVFESNL